jgi:glycosyltransferase involved in cell wall biosynthesis
VTTREAGGGKTLHVFDANCSWVRSCVNALPAEWSVRHYRIYSPHWFPNGWRDWQRCFRSKSLSNRIDEIFVPVPGWNRFPEISTRILFSALKRGRSKADHYLFAFPFYSGVAKAIKDAEPRAKLAYWAHDAFAFYDYPPGYIDKHEKRMIPLCDLHFAMAPLLIEDYAARFPAVRFELLRDAVSASFLERHDAVAPPRLQEIIKLGRPVVGVIGQINRSYDWDLLEAAARMHKQTQFVFLGSLFQEGDITARIRGFFEWPNVHWIGAVPHKELPDWMSGFDICLNPLAVDAHNHRRDPLRTYDYLTTRAPIYSQALHGVCMHRDWVEIFLQREDLIERLGSVPEPLSAAEVLNRMLYLKENTWSDRAAFLAERFDSIN